MAGPQASSSKKLKRSPDSLWQQAGGGLQQLRSRSAASGTKKDLK